MEADIRAVYHVDNRELSWRQRAAFLRHLPDGAAVRTIGNDGPQWSLEAHLLDDLRIAVLAAAGVAEKDNKPHPQRPKPTTVITPERRRALSDARRRARERRRRLDEATEPEGGGDE